MAIAAPPSALPFFSTLSNPRPPNRLPAACDLRRPPRPAAAAGALLRRPPPPASPPSRSPLLHLLNHPNPGAVPPHHQFAVSAPNLTSHRNPNPRGHLFRPASPPLRSSGCAVALPRRILDPFHPVSSVLHAAGGLAGGRLAGAPPPPPAPLSRHSTQAQNDQFVAIFHIEDYKERIRKPILGGSTRIGAEDSAVESLKVDSLHGQRRGACQLVRLRPLCPRTRMRPPAPLGPLSATNVERNRGLLPSHVPYLETTTIPHQYAIISPISMP